MFACIHSPEGSPSLRELAESFSPQVEMAGPDTALFSIDGLQLLFGTPVQIAAAIERKATSRVQIAIARHPDTALLAARHYPGVTLIAPGEELRYLGPFPLDALPLTAEMYATLDRWGIRTLADFARLPEQGVAERLGRLGHALRQLARGEAGRPLRFHQPAAEFSDSVDLDHPVALLEPLLFLLARSLQELMIRLESRGMAVGEIRIEFRLNARRTTDRVLKLPFPSRDARALLKLLHLELEAHPAESAVLGYTMSIEPVDPRVEQKGLFLPPTPEPEKLELTLEKIRAMVGAENAGYVELLDTHRPEPWRMLRWPPERKMLVPAQGRLGFRCFRPPLHADVAVVNERPSQVQATLGVRGKVLEAAGPWRTSGDWWRRTAWDRDEWDLLLSNGGLYRVYRQSNSWHVEGSYD